MNIPPLEIINLIRETSGALSICEALALSTLAGIIPDQGLMVECGSAFGKSAIATASGYRGPDRTFFLIDPLYSEAEKVPMGIISEPYADVWAHCHPYFFGATSEVALPALIHQFGKEPVFSFAWTLIDSGDHSYELAKSETDFVAPRTVKGGLIVFHDLSTRWNQSQFSGPRRLFDELLANGGFVEQPIDFNSIKDIVARNGWENGNNSWHHAGACCLGALRKL